MSGKEATDSVNASKAPNSISEPMEKCLRIYARNVYYRQGVIEVMYCHPGFVNIETWGISSEADPTCDFNDLDDELIEANTEIELTPTQARSLAELLLATADHAEQHGERPEGE